MVRIEFQKIFKRKYHIIIVLLALILSLYSYLIMKNQGAVFIRNDSQMYDISFFVTNLIENYRNELNLSEEEEEALIKIDMRHFGYPSLNEIRDNKDKMDPSDYDTAFRRGIFDVFIDKEERIREVRKELPEEVEKAIGWKKLENDLQEMYKTPSIESLNYFDSNNPFRILIYGSKYIFGFIPVVILISLFLSMIVEEKNKENILLFKTMPVKTSSILLSKLLTMVSLAFLYSIAAIIFSLVFSLVGGYNWHNGHFEVYRIFTNGSGYKYLLGYQLLIKIVLYFLLMVCFFSSITIFLSGKLKDYIKGIIFIVGIMAILSILTNTFSSFKQIYNPLYALDIKNNVLGYIDYVVNEDSWYPMSVVVNSNGEIVYYIYFSLSFIILYFLKSIFFKEEREISTINKTHDSLFSFEIGKIKSSEGFSSVLIASTVIVILIFSLLLVEDKEYEKYEVENNFSYYFYTQLTFAREQARLISASFEDESLEEIQNVKKYEKLYNDSINAQEYYFEKNGEEYYKLKQIELNDNLMPGHRAIRNFNSGLATRTESEVLYNYLSENKINPVLISNIVFLSEYENFVADKYNYIDDNIYSHSSLYLPRRLERTYPLDLIIIGIISMMALGGYSFDKEDGNQIEFLYTEPVDRRKYHTRKVLSSFLVGLLGLGIIFVLLLILGLISEGFGDPNFPIVEYVKDIDIENLKPGDTSYFRLIPIWVYDLRLLASYIFQIGFLASLGAFISIFVKEKIKVVGFTLGITGLFSYLMKLVKSPIRILSPFSHMGASKLANGSVIVGSGLEANNFYLSPGVLLAWTLVFTLIGSFIVKKKEVR